MQINYGLGLPFGDGNKNPLEFKRIDFTFHHLQTLFDLGQMISRPKLSKEQLFFAPEYLLHNVKGAKNVYTQVISLSSFFFLISWGLMKI